MEAASENRRRGRPAKWSPEIMDTLRDGFPDMGDRQRQNRLTMITAIQRLQEAEDPRYAPLLSDETSSVSVLAELGRIEDPLTFLEAVEWWLAGRPKVKEAVAMIRYMRTGKAPKGSTHGLHCELIAKINDFTSRHPDVTGEQVREALRLTQMAAEDLL